MATNFETLDSSLEDSELLQFRKELEDLKNEIKEGVEPSITKGPEKMNNGKVLFDYEKNGQSWEIITEKSGDTYKIRIKKRKDGKWYTQKFGNNETYDFTAKDKQSFNKGLGNALDKIVGNDRDRLPKTGGIVYDMLNGQDKKNSIGCNMFGVLNTIINKTDQGQENKVDKKENKEKEGTMPKGLEFDNGTYVYTVQSGDCESKIRKKLENYAPLDYLKKVSNGISGFNFSSIPDNKLLPGLKIPVPKPDNERIKTIAQFKEEQKKAIKDMRKNSTYKDKMEKLFKSKKEGGYGYSVDDIANAMTAYAKSETCPEDYDDKVGKLSLFRYERTHKCPSYGYYHVLYEGEGLNAFNKSGITIGQACNPKESGKLFLAFCIEKSSDSYYKFFDINNSLNWCCEKYNGKLWKLTNPNYDTKLKTNYKKAKEN